ncbi:MAG: hypothetical protein NTW96_07765 [Planctomycetia bacterium]|nr:hypothetical protein [Planctomycetia bacterium]
MTSLPRKGATSIRSIANRRISRGASAWRKYLRLARLEFEREHRDRDLHRIGERAEDDQRRLVQIEEEETDLATSIEAARRGDETPAGAPRGESSDARDAATFVLRY